MNLSNKLVLVMPVFAILILGQFTIVANDNLVQGKYRDGNPISSLPLSVPLVPTQSPSQSEEYSFVDKWGTQGTGNGQFNNPTGILIDDTGSVYVSDYLNNNVQKFTENNDFITKFGTGDGQFLRPFGIDFDSQGIIYVVDQVNQKIQKFSSDGTFLTEWGTGTLNPTDIVIDRNTDTVFVTIQFTDQVRKFTKDGTLVDQWGSTGSGNGQFRFPRGITMDSEGYIYVTDIIPNTKNYRVQKFTSGGQFVASWGSLGGDSTALNYNGYGLTADNEDNILVADTFSDRIQKFTNNGVFITEFGSSGTEDGKFNYPHSVEVDSSGRVYVTDLFNSRVQVFALSNQHGPPDGRGPPDERGPPQPTEIIVTQRQASQPTSVGPGGSGESSAVCNPDEVVTGGGYLGGGNQFFITKDKAEGNAWIVGGTNQNTQSQNPVLFTAYAQCAKLV